MIQDSYEMRIQDSSRNENNLLSQYFKIILFPLKCVNTDHIRIENIKG